MSKALGRITRGLAVASLVGVVAVGSAGLHAHASSLAGDAVTYNLTFNGTTYPFNAVETNNHGTLTGTVAPPNTSCPGVLNGTLSKGKLSLTFTYPNTPCSPESTVLTGTQYRHRGHGTVSDNLIGSGTYTFTDATLSSPSACAAGGRVTALSCAR